MTSHVMTSLLLSLQLWSELSSGVKPTVSNCDPDHLLKSFVSVLFRNHKHINVCVVFILHVMTEELNPDACVADQLL